jgi:hypothetical protein
LFTVQDDQPGVKGGWIAPEWLFRSEMGQNFYMAIVALGACLGLTLVVSLATSRTKTDAELKGLVYSLTPRLTTVGQPCTAARAYWPSLSLF